MHPHGDPPEAPLRTSRISKFQKLLEMVFIMLSVLSVGVMEQEVSNARPLPDRTVPVGGVSSPHCNLSV